MSNTNKTAVATSMSSNTVFVVATADVPMHCSDESSPVVRTVTQTVTLSKVGQLYRVAVLTVTRGAYEAHADDIDVTDKSALRVVLVRAFDDFVIEAEVEDTTFDTDISELREWFVTEVAKCINTWY